jgi:hypothetical protein
VIIEFTNITGVEMVFMTMADYAVLLLQ